MNAKATLPPDWKPATYNPNFDVSEEFEEQETRLRRLSGTLNVLSDLSITSGHDCRNDVVTLRREDLVQMFLMLREKIDDTAEHNGTMHKHVCGIWGEERIQAERELRGDA